MLFDIPFILLGALLLPTILRGTFLAFLFMQSPIYHFSLMMTAGFAMLKDVCSLNTAEERRWAVLQQFFMLLLDIPAFACFLVVFVTGYRFPRMMRQIAQPGTILPWEPYGKHSAIVRENRINTL